MTGKVVIYAFITCGISTVLVWAGVALSYAVWGSDAPLPMWWSAVMITLFAGQIGGAVVGAVATFKHVREDAAS